MYCSLLLMGIDTCIYVVCSSTMKYQFFKYLDFYKIPYLTEINDAIKNGEFNKYVVITYRSDLNDSDKIPNNTHKIFNFVNNDNTIYISHRSDINPREFKNVLCLNPAGISHNYDLYYLCENMMNDSYDFKQNNIRYLIQGHFKHKHRDFGLIKCFLETRKKPIKIISIGDNIDSNIVDDRFYNFRNLNEFSFFRYCNSVEFLLPLINNKFPDNRYETSRFSTTLGISWMFNKPMLLHSSIQEIYKCPSLVYNSDTEFLDLMEWTSTITHAEYMSLTEKCKSFKEILRIHNRKILSKFFV